MKIDEKEMEQRRLSVSRITECRKQCGLKQKDIAKELYYSEVYISEIVNCKKRLTKKLAGEMADLFNKKFEEEKILMTCVCDVRVDTEEKARMYTAHNSEAEYIGNGIVRFFSTKTKHVSPEYLQGYETNVYEDLTLPAYDNNLRECIKDVLATKGYAIKIGFCPDTLDPLSLAFPDDVTDECITSETNLAFKVLKKREETYYSTCSENNATCVDLLPHFQNDSGIGNTIIKWNDKQIELSPLETRNLLEDIEEAILSIVKRSVTKRQFFDMRKERFKEFGKEMDEKGYDKFFYS